MAVVLDWESIRQEYITSDKSYRELAREHGVHHSTVFRKVKRDGWQEERAKFRAKTLAAQAETQGADVARGVASCIAVAEVLLKRIRMRVESDDAPILPQEYRQLTGAVKDIRDILTSDLDVQKKRADIEAVRRQLGEGKDNTVRVVIEGGGDYDG